MKIRGTSFKRPPAGTARLSAPNPAAGHCQLTPPPETPGHSCTSLGQCLVGSLLLSPGLWCTQDSVCALQESVSPVLFKFRWLYGGINGDFLQEDLCHTEVYCTQSPCRCSSPLLTCTSSGDTQAQFCLSLYGVSGSWCTQGMFEPSAAAKLLQSCPTQCDPIDSSPPDSSIPGILQARIMEWVAVSFCTEPSEPSLIHHRADSRSTNYSPADCSTETTIAES